MTAQRDKKHEPGLAGAVDLDEQELSGTQLDQAQGGADQRPAVEQTSAGPKARAGSAVGMHEITGALIKIN